MSAADRTRDAILDAFLELVHRENAVNISVPAVAEEAGVSVRTVYRYFPSKDDLQTAAAYRMSEVILRPVTTADDPDPEIIGPYLATLWSGFARSIPAVIAEHTTPAGRELRRTRLPRARERARTALAARVGTDGGVDAELVDLGVAVSSSSMFLELVDRMGHPPERAAAMASRLVQLILTEAIATHATAENGEPQ